MKKYGELSWNESTEKTDINLDSDKLKADLDLDDIQTILADFKASKKILPRTAVLIEAAGLTFDTTAIFDGELATRYILECYDAANPVTRTLSFIDENGVTVWAGAAHADATKPSVPIDVELDGTYTVRITLSGVAGGTGGTDYLTIFGR